MEDQSDQLRQLHQSDPIGHRAFQEILCYIFEAQQLGDGPNKVKKNPKRSSKDPQKIPKDPESPQ